MAVEVDDDGAIALVAPGSPRGDADDAGGPLVPAMPNLHSHAFQRGVAGRTGHAGSTGEDSFWTWRQAMYAFLERLDPDGFEAIAAQVYVEMAKAGYGAVAEFHYVHHDPAGRPYADRGEMAKRVLAAARRAGTPLTLLPVYYAHGGFNAAPPSPAQRRERTVLLDLGDRDAPGERFRAGSARPGGDLRRASAAVLPGHAPEVAGREQAKGGHRG